MGMTVAYRFQQLLKLKNTSALFEALQLLERLGDVARANGLSEGRLMTQSFGPFNQIVLYIDYPDLATYEREMRSLLELSEFRELAKKLDNLAVEEDPGETTMWEDISSEDAF